MFAVLVTVSKLVSHHVQLFSGCRDLAEKSCHREALWLLAGASYHLILLQDLLL